MNSLRGRINNRQLTKNFVQRLQSLKLRCTSTATNVSGSSNSEPEIQIPFRKERTSTDILIALERTISRDYTAPHYKYHDDPFLIPLSNKAKRVYALSKESGRKAAMWIHQEHADLFDQRLSEPEIKKFMPKANYENKDEVSEELLMSVINEGQVPDALTIYKLLDKEVSTECKQALLELLCYHNSQEQLSDDLIEERWYRKAASRHKQAWRSIPELEELFEFLKQQDKPIAAAAYNALISGTAKYMNIDRAWALYEECEEKGIPLSLTAYNHIIQLVSVLRDGPQEKRTLLLELLRKIDQAGLRPNVATLNFALRVVSTINIHNIAKDLARLLFTEFKNIGVEPSLGSYYFALLIFCKDRGVPSGILGEILVELEGKSFKMKDSTDTFFFVTAMEMARNHLKDRAIAEKIHKLAMTGKNYDLMGESFKESIYYRHYMVLLLKTMPFEEFMEIYDLLVPNVYIPEPTVMQEILSVLEITEPTSTMQNVLPRLWSHMVMFEHLDRENLTSKAFNLMRTTFSPSADSPINKQYAAAAWSLWTFIQSQSEHRLQRTVWHGKTLADVAILSLRGDEFDRCLEALSKMVTEQNSLIGTADIEQLNIIVDACLERGHAQGACSVLQYSVEAGFEESYTMAQKIKRTIPLSAEEDLHLDKLVGSKVVKEIRTEETNEN